MSKSNTFENDLLQLIFNGGAIANMADNASASPLTDLYVSLHTGNPGEAGNQATNECAYTSYARVAVARNSGGWTVSGSAVTPVADILFPQCTAADSETVTHFGIGTAASGAGKILYYGSLNDTIAVAQNVQPKLDNTTNVTED